MSTTQHDDDRLHRYLSARAQSISLPVADSSGIVVRATRRRHRRRTLSGVAALAVLATGGALLATQRPEGNPVEAIGAAAPGVVDSTLEWTVVEPDIGLGFSRSTTTTGDGALYSLSTAPGPADYTDSSTDMRARLYRSDDGAEWSEIDLPDDLWASSLASDDGRLYALGTAPAGGARRVVVRSTDDGGGSWSDQAVVSPELDDLQARFPGQLTLEPRFATGADGLLATVVVRAVPDLNALVPGFAASGGVNLTSTGVDVLAVPPGCEPTGSGGMACLSETEVVPPSTPSPVGPDGGDERRQEVIASYSWQELGLDPTLRTHLGGRMYTFLSTDGRLFEPVGLTVGAADVAFAWPVVADDGIYRVFVTSVSPPAGGEATPTTTALRSIDGRTWERDSFGEAEGYLLSVGTLDGRPAVVLDQNEGRRLWMTALDGTWAAIDPRTAVPPGSEVAPWVVNQAFGPLGFAAVVMTDDPNDPGRAVGAYVVHSSDGVNLSVIPVDEYLDDAERLSVAGVEVTADFITVRLDDGDDDPATPPRQRLLVGTPRD